MPKLPNFRFEKAVLKRIPDAIVVGVDEAGCAPLAGPVVAGAVILDQKKIPKSLRQGLNDSKQIVLEKREELFAILTSCGAAVVGVGRAEVHEIESFNILNAAHMAMRRAVESLGRAVTIALVDGNRRPKEFPCEVETIVRGDEKSMSIAAASIIAKVTRDRYMVELSRAYPGYGWEHNAGYPTPDHRAAILKLGLTPHHRKTFGTVKRQLAGPEASQVEMFETPAG
ncbi:MAG: ribonuclease HII [Rhodospirillaceae bacterium]